jgi:hypothetical protein
MPTMVAPLALTARAAATTRPPRAFRIGISIPSRVTEMPLHSRVGEDCRFPWYGVVQS